MKPMPLLLLIAVAAFARQDEPCQTPIQQYGPSIESILKLPEGFSVSWLDKHVSRLGDDAAVVLVRLGAPKSLKTASDTRKVLDILRSAFDCPECLEHGENRTGGVTLLLLDAIDARNKDRQLRKLIKETRDHVLSQLKQLENRGTPAP